MLSVDREPTCVSLHSAKRGLVDDNIKPKRVWLAQSVATSLTSPRLVSHAFHLLLRIPGATTTCSPKGATELGPGRLRPDRLRPGLKQ